MAWRGGDAKPEPGERERLGERDVLAIQRSDERELTAGRHAGGVESEFGLAFGVGGDEFGATIRQRAPQGAVSQRLAPVIGGLQGGFDGFTAEPHPAGDVEGEFDFLQLELANLERALELQGLLPFSFLESGHRVLADGGRLGQRESGIKCAEFAQLHRLLGQQAALRIGETDLECGVRRYGVGLLDHVAQNAAHGHGFAGQIGGAVGVKIAFRLEPGRQLEAGQRQVVGGGMAGTQREHPHVG